MARVDDYNKAAALAAESLSVRNPKRIADQGGARFEPLDDGTAFIRLHFLNRPVRVTWPDMACAYEDSEEEVLVQQKVLLLHYLSGASGQSVTGEWMAYQEVPDGKFYLDAFLRRAKVPLVQAFGDRPEHMADLAREVYNATPLDQGDVAVVVQALPLIPVALILWRGDDEFPPEGTILFDKNTSEILSAEDIAWLAGMIVYPLLGKARR